jgi:heme/copper-type cytochrome/quinol oxidase subunit 2
VNRNQKIALAIAAANLALLLLFPPFDQHSIANSRVPVFAGFNFVFAALPRSQINSSVLVLEVIVLLVNAAVAWLLLRDRQTGAPPRRRIAFQNAVLIITAANLVLMLLFPPFESVFAVTNAALPNFEGFYFIFSQQPNHTIVTTVLYIEVIFILINGGLFWLIFKERRPGQLTSEQIQALSTHWSGKRGR